jgi:hypothetical protein
VWALGSLGVAVAIFVGIDANERLDRVNENLEQVVSLLERLDGSSAVIARRLTDPVERPGAFMRL